MPLFFMFLLSLPGLASPILSPEQLRRADRLISVFENETLAPQYHYIENLHDGRGYTAGRAGFCTATGDLLELVERYAATVPENPLGPFLPRLRELAADGDDSISGLKGFKTAWKSAAAAQEFRAKQDELVDELYFQHAAAHAKELGLVYPTSLAALYEAVIQHGDDQDPDSLGAIIGRATSIAGGTPKFGIAEDLWLEAFLRERRADLLNAYNEKTREEWRASVGRADAMLEIFRSGNFDFHGPLTVNPYGKEFQIP